MNILYMSDGEMTAKMTLRQLFANFTETETKHYPEDIETELASRGWYENLHECGHYLVLNLDKLPIEYLDPDNYADVLAILAKNDGACLYWQMPDVKRGREALRAGVVKDDGDLLVHPDAIQIEAGMAYTMK